MTPFKRGDVILNKYEVAGVLGEGGMGVVLAARHRKLRQLVALKFLRPKLRDDPELCARFAREAHTAIRITNGHVARVLDVDEVDGTPFMIMEYLTGKDLATMLKERGQLRIDESVDLLLQACEAIAEAHRLGIVHRDLKPGNLFVTTGDDGMPFVKVLDFGISKSTSVADMSVTASSAMLGSPTYMSPEQLTSSRDVDRRSDVWSLGVILYEMLAGEPPFIAESAARLCEAVFKGVYPSLSKRRPEVSADLEEAVAEALTRERDERLASVEAFAARIAPMGSEEARESHRRIQRISSRAPAPCRGSPTSSTTGEPTGPALSRSQSQPEARRSQWPKLVVLSAMAAIGATVVARLLRPLHPLRCRLRQRRRSLRQACQARSTRRAPVRRRRPPRRSQLSPRRLQRLKRPLPSVVP